MNAESIEQVVSAYITQNDISIESRLLKDGGPEGPSKWEVTISSGTVSEAFEYHAGAYHRRWMTRKEMAKKGAPYIGVGSRITPKDFKQKPYMDGRRISLLDEEILCKYTLPTEPVKTDVLYCIFVDCSFVMHGQSFEDWCSESGYSNDSIKARGIYDECVGNFMKMLRLGIDLNYLSDIFQDH